VTSHSPMPAVSKLAVRNLRMMHLLERLAIAFEEARVPVIALKGAALNLTLYERADDRPMDDLDLLIRPSTIHAATRVLEKLGAVAGGSEERNSLFPRFHYETQYVLGSLHPVKVDLHVRPFRPMRYARTVPQDALWDRAVSCRVGHSSILIPSAEDLLLQVAVHVAVHGFSRPMWLEDVGRWLVARGRSLHWAAFLKRVEAWCLALPVREAFARLAPEGRAIVPAWVADTLGIAPTSWRDRRTLAQAPHDAERPILHVLTNVLCTPDLRFVLSYVYALGSRGRRRNQTDRY